MFPVITLLLTTGLSVPNSITPPPLPEFQLLFLIRLPMIPGEPVSEALIPPPPPPIPLS